jgi:5-methylthioadenosine/S-adenosylhomocysteine deaminase
MIVVPGLINAHQHFYYHLFKGLANGLLIEDWFPELVARATPHLTEDDFELTAYLAAIEMARTGTTCCLHHLRLPTSEETLRRMSQATANVGLRQVVGKEVQCRLPGNPNHPRTLDEEIEFVEQLIPRWRRAHAGLVRLCLVVECNAIFIDQQVTSEQLLVETKRLADRYRLKISTHISGGTLSFDKSFLKVLRKTGRSDTQLLMQLGLLDSSFILVHGINCSQTDIELIADSGASLVYTPTSEAVRGGGIGPAVSAISAGVNVALGSDGPMVDYSVDMVEQMKACSMLQNAKHLNPSAMPPERCLEMATINAARALGMDHEIGSLEPGKLADIAVFALGTPQSAPANNPISSLVYSARGTDARFVFVNGRQIVGDGELAFGEISHFVHRAKIRAAQIIEKAGLRERARPLWHAVHDQSPKSH